MKRQKKTEGIDIAHVPSVSIPKRRWVGDVYLLLLFCVLGLAAFQAIDLWPPPSQVANRFLVARYESRPNEKDLTPPIPIERFRGTVDKATIAFDVLAIDDNFDNFFQTANHGGMRLELQSPRTLHLIVNDQDALTLGDFDLGQWHHFEIDYIRNKRLALVRDGHTLWTSQAPAYSRDIDFSRIVVGTGFDQQRRLQGAVKNFTVEVIHAVGERTVRARNALTTALLVALATAGLWPLRRDERPLARRMVTALAAVCLAGPLTVYQTLYANKFYPITEGWFSEYGRLITSGKVPYRDFDLLLPPLYPLIISVHQRLFGDGLFSLHILGIVISCAIAFALFAVLRNVFDVVSSAAATIIGVVYYQSGSAFIGYDFTQVLTLFLLLAGLAAARYAAGIAATGAGGPSVRRNAFLAGILLALAILTKHSNGGIAAAGLAAGLLVVMIRVGNLRARSVELTIMAGGGLIPLGAIVLWLADRGALAAFVQNVVFDAMAAKGGSDSILRHAFLSFADITIVTNAQKPLLLLTCTVAAIVGLWFAVRQTTRRLFAATTTVPTTGRFLLAIAGAAVLACVVAWRMVPFASSWNELGLYVKDHAILFAVLLYVLGGTASAIVFLVRPRPTSAFGFIILVLGLAITFGNGSSAGLSEISAFLGVSIIFAAMFAWSMPYLLPALIPTAIGAAFVILLQQQKFEVPYAWWTIETKIERTDCAPTTGFLSGLCIAKPELTSIDAIVGAITRNSQPNDPVYVFPHMPSLSIMADRPAFSGAVVSWPDFMSDRKASLTARELRANPPSVIVVAQVPETVLAKHETLFRGGARSRQREIIDAIDDLKAAGTIQKAIPTQIVNTMPIDVYVRVSSEKR